MTETKSEVAVIPVSMTNRGVQLHSLDEAWRFCVAIEKSGIAPKGMQTAAIFAVVQAGAELGLTPFRSLANMKIINGRVGPMGALAKALVRSADVLAPHTGFVEKFTGTEFEDDFTATFSTQRAGETSAYHTSFSVADAKLAMLWKKEGPWKQYPKRMLMWRAVGFHMDDYYSDVLLGMHIAEVLPDYPNESVPVVMTRLETPAEDPLLDALQDPHEQELEAISAELQPPLPIEEPEVVAKRSRPKAGAPISPLSAVIAEMEAQIEENALDAADPGNAAAEGGDGT